MPGSIGRDRGVQTTPDKSQSYMFLSNNGPDPLKKSQSYQASIQCWAIIDQPEKTPYEPRHEISNNVVCATRKASDQPAHTRSLIRAFASLTVNLLTKHHLEFLRLKKGCICSSESTLVKLPHCWKSHVAGHIMAFRLWTNHDLRWYARWELPFSHEWTKMFLRVRN